MSRYHKSDCSTSTIDTIHEICENCDRKDIMFISQPKKGYCYPDVSNDNCRKFDPGTSYFNSVITPLTNLTPGFSGVIGSVEFRMRRKNKTVTLQWEPFTGNMAAAGVAFLTVPQSICNTPPYPISIPIYILYKSIGRITHIEIDPYAKSGNIKLFLNIDGSSTGITAGDAISVPGGSITWIVD